MRNLMNVQRFALVVCALVFAGLPAQADAPSSSDPGRYDAFLSYSRADSIAFIQSLFPLFRDRRYVTVDGRPLLAVYKIDDIPQITATVALWRETCRREGIGEIYLAAVQHRANDDPTQTAATPRKGNRRRWPSTSITTSLPSSPSSIPLKRLRPLASGACLNPQVPIRVAGSRS